MAPIRLATVLVGFVQSPSPQRAFHPTSLKLISSINTSINTSNPYTPLTQTNHRRRTDHGRAILASSTKLQASAIGAVGAVGAASTVLDLKPALYMSLLAVQFACQPMLTKKFTPKSINRSTVVISQDLVKVIMGLSVLLITGSWTEAIAGWSIRSWLTVAGIPAFLYCIQNIATLIAYQNIPPLTFNVLNQTKTLSAALCCYIFMGRVQSKIQIASLILLFTSACIIEKLIPFRKNTSVESTKTKTTASSSSSSSSSVVDQEKNSHSEGVIAVLLASFISGLAGALTQKNLQSYSTGIGTSAGRNSYLFTMELSVASLIFMCISMLRTGDGKRIRSDGFFHNWTPKTCIPIVTNAAGGVIVGLVTKHAGAVKKGFALIFGLALSGVLQAVISNDEDSKISVEQIVGGMLAAVSLWMHNSFPAK